MNKKSKILKGLILEPKTLTKEESKKFIDSWEEVNKSSCNLKPALIEPYHKTKPIFTIGLPMSMIENKEFFEKTSIRLKNRLIDYHVLVYSQHLSVDIVFQAFYEKDFKKDEFERLKKEILAHINNE